MECSKTSKVRVLRQEKQHSEMHLPEHGSARKKCASHQERSTLQRFILQRLDISRDYATLCCTTFLTY
uniref:Uncharacterized protein n=1 Tax=Hyaloperonospora arabidopsidis (strain Emoy2) TaxID=559515 RepID=M4C4J7_HYAAE